MSAYFGPKPEGKRNTKKKSGSKKSSKKSGSKKSGSKKSGPKKPSAKLLKCREQTAQVREKLRTTRKDGYGRVYVPSVDKHYFVRLTVGPSAAAKKAVTLLERQNRKGGKGKTGAVFKTSVGVNTDDGWRYDYNGTVETVRDENKNNNAEWWKLKRRVAKVKFIGKSNLKTGETISATKKKAGRKAADEVPDEKKSGSQKKAKKAKASVKKEPKVAKKPMAGAAATAPKKKRKSKFSTKKKSKAKKAKTE